MNKYTISALVLTLAFATSVAAQTNMGGFDGPSIKNSSVAEALKMNDDTPVVLTGKIEKALGDEKYQFSDGTASIVVEIDDDDWRGITVKPENTVELRGEIDKELMQNPEVDVDSVILK